MEYNEKQWRILDLLAGLPIAASFGHVLLVMTLHPSSYQPMEYILSFTEIKELLGTARFP